MKKKHYIILYLTFFSLSAEVFAAISPQGVLAGKEKTYAFVKNLKTGKVSRKNVQFTSFTNLETGENFIAECPKGTCDKATPGTRSIEKSPFKDIKEVGCNKVIKKGKSIDCIGDEVAQYVGEKPMEFFPPGGKEDKFDEDSLKGLPSKPMTPQVEPGPNPGESFKDWFERNPQQYCKHFTNSDRCANS